MSTGDQEPREEAVADQEVEDLDVGDAEEGVVGGRQALKLMHDRNDLPT